MLTSKTTQSLISNNLVPMVVEQTGRENAHMTYFRDY